MGGLNENTNAIVGYSSSSTGLGHTDQHTRSSQAGNAITTLTLVGWATSTQGKPLSLRLTREEPPAVVPVREWRGEVLPNGPPARPQSSFPAPGTNELVVTVAEQLGAGRCGSVLAVDTLRLTDPNNPKTRLLYPQPPHLPELVIKVADAEHEDSLKHEAAIYNEMEPLQGVSIPRAYGFFTAELDPDTIVPSLSSDVSPTTATPRRLSILLLERLGEMLPLGQKLPEEWVPSLVSSTFKSRD